ncbi:MAG: AI-2E family transporter [Helicobacteraceae bacterium]|jgi:predicted PurR-regulated permease PerM|nr:AI-2E family transporter [Helicobacteraceae bacterium]
MKPQHIILTLLAFALYWMYLLYEPFLLTIMIGSLLAVSTASLQRRLEQQTNSILVASILSTVILAILFFAPLGYFLTTFTLYLTNIDITIIEKVYRQFSGWATHLPSYLAFAQPFIDDALDEIEINKLATHTLTMAGTIGSYSAGFLKNAMLIIIFYFFSHFYGKTVFAYFRRVIQLPQQDATLLSFELSSVMSVVFYSILTTAVFEGALFGIAVAFMGYNGLLFGIMYGFTSLIPVVGGALLWIPFMIYELSYGHTGSAIFITLYSIIVISIIADTIIKPIIIKEINFRIVKTNAQMNELLIFFAIIAGLGAFGFWGMILGPAITAFFLSLLKLIEQRQKIVETT